MSIYDVIIVGGGAAGFFSAIQIKEKNSALSVLVLEKSQKVLSKVKVSGGGRCNVTHACWEPKELVKFYPRGNKELLGPFHQFMCGDMMEWLDQNGVATHIEDDGRVFPLTNSSQTIIDCFQDRVDELGVVVHRGCGVNEIKFQHDQWSITSDDTKYNCNKIVIASGSSKKVWEQLSIIGHKIISPIPSLFSLKTKDAIIKGQAGTSFKEIWVSVKKEQFVGPALITHEGISGPAILKLSAWKAKELFNQNYEGQIVVNWLGEEEEVLYAFIEEAVKTNGNKKIANYYPEQLTKRFWRKCIENIGLDESRWNVLSDSSIEKLVKTVTSFTLKFKGKSTNKEEFVTCGGVALKEVNFKTMESKIKPRLYFAGEVLDIDAVTGGFNFQAAWTTSFILSSAIANDS